MLIVFLCFCCSYIISPVLIHFIYLSISYRVVILVLLVPRWQRSNPEIIVQNYTHVSTWKLFPRYRPFAWGFHRSHRWDEKHLSLGIWFGLYYRVDGIVSRRHCSPIWYDMYLITTIKLTSIIVEKFCFHFIMIIIHNSSKSLISENVQIKVPVYMVIIIKLSVTDLEHIGDLNIVTTWWRHSTETLSALVPLYEGNQRSSVGCLTNGQ